MSSNNRFNVRLPVNEDPAVKAVEAQYVKEITEADVAGQVAASELPVALDFYAKDSKACETFAPRFAAVAEKFSGKVRFLKLLRDGSATAGKLGVTTSPTIVFLSPGGAEKGERLGGEDIKRTDLKARVEGLLGVLPVPPTVAAPKPGAP